MNALAVILILTGSPSMMTSQSVPTEAICEELGQEWLKTAPALSNRRYQCLVAREKTK